MDRRLESNGADEAAIDPRTADGQSARATLSGASVNEIPTFKYNLSNPRQHNYGCIVVGDEVFHRLGNVNEFHAALGYTEEMGKAGVVPDEFIWQRYTSDGAVKSARCLQVQIAVYLHKHSSRFRELYGRSYDEMIGGGIAGCVDDSDEHCFNCPKHPGFKSNTR